MGCLTVHRLFARPYSKTPIVLVLIPVSQVPPWIYKVKVSVIYGNKLYLTKKNKN